MTRWEFSKAHGGCDTRSRPLHDAESHPCHVPVTVRGLGWAHVAEDAAPGCSKLASCCPKLPPCCPAPSCWACDLWSALTGKVASQPGKVCRKASFAPFPDAMG